MVFFVDDKYLVIDGYNNVIFQIKPFNNLDKKDNELLKIIKRLNKKEVFLKKPNLINGKIELYLREIKLNFKNMPWDMSKKILEIATLTQEELHAQPIVLSFSKPSFSFVDKKAKFLFNDVDYQNYEKICELISPYSDHQKISKENYLKILIKRAKKIKNDF